MENSPELKALIRQNAHLFWYTKDEEKENLPLPVVVEFFLNYATREEINKLFALVSKDKVAEIFFNQIETWGERSNYFPMIQNYFSLYFKKYVPQYS
jgi:hypothetical protein